MARRLAVTMPSRRPSARSRGSTSTTSQNASSSSCSGSLCSRYAAHELVDALGVERPHLRRQARARRPPPSARLPGCRARAPSSQRASSRRRSSARSRSACRRGRTGRRESAPPDRMQRLSSRRASEVEAPGRRRRAGVRPRATVEQPRDLLRPPVEHRADERPHHVPEERVGGDLEVEVLAALVPGRGEDTPQEDVVLRLRRREGAEVVLAEQQVGGGGERVEIEPAAGTTSSGEPRAASARAGGRCGSDSCASGPSDVRGSPAAPPPPRPRPRRRVAACSAPPPCARRAGRRPTSTLTTFPSACTPVSVRPATATFSATEKSEPSASHDDALDRAQPGLRRPAVEARAVVLERELQPHARSLSEVV